MTLGPLYPLPSLCPLSELVDQVLVEDVHAASGAGLLPLEPGLQACRMEDVVTWKLLAARDHLLTADDTHIVDSLQFLNGGIRIARRGRRKELSRTEEREKKEEKTRREQASKRMKSEWKRRKQVMLGKG